ncbi:hypothetical protein QR680_013564 [Steinernema hermaphroditum]|uniref:Peptidase S1 domain-containing protein n=1 Tax=Steinernema hermaphroditum TaxID=289476 RepID=A0AA39I5Z0_9BILA|nr:hypothetical protein QR680_013564 [Steinernema hermaphroditum]
MWILLLALLFVLTTSRSVEKDVKIDEPVLFSADPEESMELLKKGRVNVSNLIYGGTKARPGQFPQHAFVMFKDASEGYYSVCGGTLISRTHVLTAAHCSWGSSIAGSRIMVGGLNNQEHSGSDQWRNVRRIVHHPGYRPRRIGDDIAVVEFSPAVTLNRNTKLARIATDDSKLLRIRKSYVTGYGTVTWEPQPRSSQVLLWSEITLFSPSECRQKLEGAMNNKQICAGAKNKGAGQGDSGGPIQVLSNKQLWQVGLTSFGGTTSHYDDEHNQDRFPTVFTRVSSYCDFLSKSTNGAFRCQ